MKETNMQYVQPSDLYTEYNPYKAPALTALQPVTTTAADKPFIPFPLRDDPPPVSDQFIPFPLRDASPVSSFDPLVMHPQTLQPAPNPVASIPQPGTQIVNFGSPAPANKPQVYVEGYIRDNVTKEIIPGTIQLVANASGLALTDPYFVVNGNYSAYTDQSPFEVAVKFMAPGYAEKKVQVSTLQNSPDVLLSKKSGFPLIALAIIPLVLMNNKKKKVNGIGAIDTNTIMTIGLGVLMVKGFNLLGGIFDKFGFGTDPTKDERSNPDSPWKPGYWQRFTTFSYAINETTAKDMCKTIHNAFTLVNDDFNAINGVFSLLRTKANVSFLAWEFQKIYNEDLLSFLTDGGGILPWDGLSTAHLKILISYVKKLPNS